MNFNALLILKEEVSFLVYNTYLLQAQLLSSSCLFVVNIIFLEACFNNHFIFLEACSNQFITQLLSQSFFIKIAQYYTIVYIKQIPDPVKTIGTCSHGFAMIDIYIN